MLSITTQTRVGPGLDLNGWAGRSAAEPVGLLVSCSSEHPRNCHVGNLKMHKRKKRPGGAEKQRLKNKCAKLTDLFGARTTNSPAATGVLSELYKLDG